MSTFVASTSLTLDKLLFSNNPLRLDYYLQLSDSASLPLSPPFFTHSTCASFSLSFLPRFRRGRVLPLTSRDHSLSWSLYRIAVVVAFAVMTTTVAEARSMLRAALVVVEAFAAATLPTAAIAVGPEVAAATEAGVAAFSRRLHSR